MTMESKEALHALANNCGDMANSIAVAAEQANQYLRQSVTDTAVCASNIQVVANATIRLAGDIGTIFAILNATELDRDIFSTCERAVEIGKDVGYESEVLSQEAINTSILTSQISLDQILDLAKEISDMMGNLLKDINLDVDSGPSDTGTLEGESISVLDPTSENISEDPITLARQIIDAQSLVDQCLDIVNLCKDNAAHILELSGKTKSRKIRASSYKTLAEDIIRKTLSLRGNLEIALSEMQKADEMAKKVAVGFQTFAGLAISFVEVISKLNVLIIRKKALVPWVSVDLVSLCDTADRDATTVLSLTSVAIKSALSELSANVASLASLSLLNTQSELLLGKLVGKVSAGNSEIDLSLRFNLDQSYREAAEYCEKTNGDYVIATNQLNTAIDDLVKAQTQLSSLQTQLGSTSEGS